jgi:acetyltransferase-like isoleucine patch superfamily enzyme
METEKLLSQTEEEKLQRYRIQHMKRLNWMPWLYYSLSQKNKAWALEWQGMVQDKLAFLETIVIGDECFISSESNLFAEPGRTISLGHRSWIGGNAFLHGPIQVGEDSSINHGVKMDGGRAGIRIGNGVRIAPGCAIYAFNHMFEVGTPISKQGTSSKGIKICDDVWIGANCSIADGVEIGEGCVVGMGAVVTKSFEAGNILAGVPAKIVRKR